MPDAAADPAPDPPPAPLERFVRSHLGEVRAVRMGSDPNASARLWRLEPADPARPAVILKLHRAGRGARQEAAALAAWGPRLPPGAVPELLARHPRLPALLLGELPGAPPDPSRPPDPAHDRALGRLLARLHALPVPDDDALPLAEALSRRLGAALRGAAPLLPPGAPEALRGSVTAALGPLLARRPRRTPCHRDVAMRNVLVAADGGAALLDFEHARPDLWLVDLAELAGVRWHARPDLEAAFWNGYGRPPGAAERDALAAVRALHALATLGWAERHADAERRAFGRILLRRARRELARRGYGGA